MGGDNINSWKKTTLSSFARNFGNNKMTMSCREFNGFYHHKNVCCAGVGYSNSVRWYRFGFSRRKIPKAWNFRCKSISGSLRILGLHHPPHRADSKTRPIVAGSIKEPNSVLQQLARNFGSDEILL